MSDATASLPGPRGVLFRVEVLADPRVRLFLTSGTLLFVELLLIRWIPANVRYIGFFSNFLLMASFLGIGVGILLGRKGWRPPPALFAVLLLAVVGLILAAQLNVQVNSDNELFFGLAESKAADVNFLVLPLVVVLVTTVMAALALPLGPLFRSMRPLNAYAIDIVGSMAGILGFTVLSAAGTNPVVWFLVLAGLMLLLAVGNGLTAWSAVGGLAMLGVLYAVSMAAASGDIWSPYYRISLYEQASTGLMKINVNGIPHQTLHPLDRPTDPFYRQVYDWFPGRTFDEVLIVGAGSGSDVAVALDRGAKHVDAVEIDPEIQRIGVEQHPDHPYDDPRVTRIVNDGRAFLRNTDKRYDLVIFALPDSLTLVSRAANVRLESFLFTEEAFASVREHLTDDGVFVLYNNYRKPWLIEKLSNMLSDTFGAEPLLRTYRRVQATLAAGPLVNALNGGPPPGDTVDTVKQSEVEPTSATDDWPFLYLRTGYIARYYLVALAIILAFALLAVLGAARATGTPIRRFSPHFFVLGTAFLLLETRSLVSFSLLFGTTWIVNALAFFAILASVLVAILINARFPIRHPNVFYVGLFASLAVAFLLPPEQLLIDPPWLRYVVAAALAFTPVFFANLVFSHSFRDTTTADMAFASNLLGAMVGGALEYLALLTGYQALLPLVAVLYLLAWLFATRWRRLADRDLETAPPPDGEDEAGRGTTEPRPALEGSA